jgi:hypothetical protein
VPTLNPSPKEYTGCHPEPATAGGGSAFSRRQIQVGSRTANRKGGASAPEAALFDGATHSCSRFQLLTVKSQPSPLNLVFPPSSESSDPETHPPRRYSASKIPTQSPPAAQPETNAACPDKSCTAPQAPNESHAPQYKNLPTPPADGIAAPQSAPPARKAKRFPTGSEMSPPSPARRQSSGANVPDKSAPGSSPIPSRTPAPYSHK